MELGNLAEEREAEDKEDSDSNRHSGDEDDGESKGGNKRNVARTFRYMRKRPTIIFYKPPEGEFFRCDCCELLKMLFMF